MHAKSHQRRCSSRARPLAKVDRCRGKLIGGREALCARINGIALSSSAFRFRCSQVDAQPISGSEKYGRKQPSCEREDTSHAQRNYGLQSYESNREHHITSGPRTPAADARHDPLRSSLRKLQGLLRSRACGLSDLRLR